MAVSSNIEGPVLDGLCNVLRRGRTPTLALANGVWLGSLLVARVRHNRCIIRVSSSGMHKMIANVISFQHPSHKIYSFLPPPLEDLDEMLACVFTGPCAPTAEDFKRTPALEWLKLNHIDYAKLGIAYDELDRYPESGPPRPEATSVHDMEENDGNEKGPCPFTVHGITGDDYNQLSLKALKALAVRHLMEGGKVLAIGHNEVPESIFDNPQLYPQMFPWLFPYGLGGIGQRHFKSKLSGSRHKRHLLLFHDKRFQVDEHFPLVAFNHEQIKGSTSSGFILTNKSSFKDIVDRLFSIDVNVLQTISTRLKEGTSLPAQSEEESACYQVIRDLDHVGSGVQGSITNKKFMRNEIWSLVAYKGAPTWYITLSPADEKNPISPAQTGKRYSRGFYGETDAYYGTVEQQGRLTLHLHMLLWIKSSLTPQEIRDRLMASDSEFQRRMVEYLEGVHSGEFLSGSTMEEVKERIDHLRVDDDRPTAVETLAVPPPTCASDAECHAANNCGECNLWMDHFKNTTNELLFRCNVHKCSGCCSNKWGKCKARFPRPTYVHTSLDPTTGALLMKKGESMLNSFTDLVTFLFRCNTDITSLLSGTAIKAVIAYISDYISKPSLRTYVVFDTIKSVYDRNASLFSGTLERAEKARKIMTQIMEIGAPMASLYLLGNPDHYTSHSFNTFYWKGYVSEVRRCFITDHGEKEDEDSIVLKRIADSVVGTSPVFDYIYRPDSFESMSLYDWVSLSEKRKITRSKSIPVDEDDTGSTKRTCKFSDFYKFLDKHPLHDTHHVRILVNSDGKVPNFVGGALPRHDKGDLDYYSCTMLTLFAPWRTGFDLKTVDETWNDKFKAYEFSDRQREMLGMIILLKCEKTATLIRFLSGLVTATLQKVMTTGRAVKLFFPCLEQTAL
ncbi:hypothetical protein BJ138DRAFT_1138502 [Hygrophoropsis aurantiaca]|uniref:Uncharacterized protein n=1 Tax=Hygrophoropsis aurantiaca TaxID=72124 RepID=A0ACB7ZUZ8_9AGAM|nr:hypothetical protein BJ138DRAFT_1138502 [Hygrophoropsis aurantiaca]